MSDPNKDLVAQIARRVPSESNRTDPPLVDGDWNVPIDVTQADCMSARQIIRGQAAAAKAVAARWLPSEMPEDWRG